MAQTFTFDDGQTWNARLTGTTYQRRDEILLGVRFWSDAAPDQYVFGRLSRRGLVRSEEALAEALRRALKAFRLRHDLDDVPMHPW